MNPVSTSRLACFNKGGRIIDGKCALGSCEYDTDLPCRGAYGSCPDHEGQPQDCRKYHDSCRRQPLCNEGLGVCPMRTAKSSRKTCREARIDDCTIDSCR